MNSPVDFRSRAIEYVEHVLKECRLNPSTLAHKAGLEPSSLNRPLNSETYRGVLSLNTIGKIANATGVDPAPFFALIAGKPSASEDKPVAEGVGQRIADRLKQINENPSSVSLKAGLARSAVRDIIVNDANPRIDTLRKLAGPLQCDLGYLTGQKGSALEGEKAVAPSLGQRIRAARNANGFTQEAVATSLGVSVQAVSQWENDANSIELPNLLKLQNLLGTTLVGTSVSFDQPALTDLLGFLHFLRAERGVDVPERHFETLRALTASKSEGAANG